jgi:hypothetical protein
VPYDTRDIITDAKGKAIPQYFESDSDSFKPLQGKDGASNVRIVNGYDAVDDMMRVKSMQKKWRDSFVGSSLDLNKWDVISQGVGQTLTVASGQLSITTGTTIDEELVLLSKEVFTIPCRSIYALNLSQRIINQEIYVELVSVDTETGLPDDLNLAGWIYDATSATQAKYRVQNGGMAPLASGAVTIPSTATYAVAEVEAFADEAWFHRRVIDSTNGRSNSYVRHQQIPDPNALYKLRIRVRNLSIAPASSTTVNFQFIGVMDYAELTAEITAGRGNTVAGQGIFAQVAGTVTATGVVGPAAHDAAVSGNPVRIAGRALTSAYTSLASGDTADFITTVQGVQIVKEHCIPELSWQYTGTLTTTADAAAKAAGAAGIRNHVNGFQYQNTSAVTTEIVIKDGSTVIWKGFASANMNLPANLTFDMPLRGSAAVALNVAALTTGANVLINLQGYQAP